MRIDYLPGKNGKSTVRLLDDDGGWLHVDKLDLADARHRKRFADQAVALGADIRLIGPELLRLADEAATSACIRDCDELDAAAIVRPERIIRPELSTVAISSTVQTAIGPAGKWWSFVRWADGRRERIDLAPTIDIDRDRRLWIHPMPLDTATTMIPAWSRGSRIRWLSGGTAPDPVKTWQSVAKALADYLDFPAKTAEGTTATLSLWVLLTYGYHAWPAVPYLYLGGPAGSGKSRTFELLNAMTFRPITSSNMSAAAMFRTLHSGGGCLLLDEAEKLRSKTPDTAELLSILLAGYSRGGRASRLEPVGDGFKLIEFDVYGPKAIACIGGLPPALAGRAIPVTMFRAAPHSAKPRKRLDADADRFQDIRDDLYCLALEYGSTWLQYAKRDDLCPAMSGRDFQLWNPIFGLARWLDDCGCGGLSEVLGEYARHSIETAREDRTPSTDEILLRVFAAGYQAGELFSNRDVLERAKAVDATTFKSWTPESVSKRLRSYGIPGTQRTTGGKRVYRDLPVDCFERIESAYGIELTKGSETF